ncbi:SRPBCC domain-containing protein [Streptomyces avicenniae]|uniref:SRPBCC domain-containing protein n=1 Tax=Streptomyces avicenniae TaxID=500153 RepID=UPI000699AF90|nr:SRPBCC domain-containing protein [Streptomyces avicenniae]
MAMEHEVYVPLSATVVRRAFADPVRVARCVPGLQLAAGEGAPPDAPGPDTPAVLRGRLRLRVGSSTITYRGSLSVTERGEGIAVEGKGEEARGDGAVHLVLTVVPRPVPDGSGTTLAFGATVEAAGRLAEVEPERVEAVGRRVLDRFAETLTDELVHEATAPPAGGIGEPGDNERAIPGIPAASEPEPDPAPGPPSAVEPGAAAPQEAAEEDLHAPGGIGGETGVPTDAVLGGDALERELLGGALDDELGGELADDELTPEELALEDDDELAAVGADLPEPEADFARRTMIGRSAEEVDHAPPRGRYAPEPAPGRVPGPSAVLRWAAPAAAVAVAGAVLVGVLRRRYLAGQ